MEIKNIYLKNGLQVILKKEEFSKVSVVNILYKVGSKNDPESKKGLAHLFEHLMFCGSKKVKSYDEELQNVGGSNNAYTNFDVTNYYCILPTENIETALWLEADRMSNLSISQESLDIQKNVVTEELKESYYNSPYGDAFLHLLPLIFPQGHPYSNPIIGNKEDIQKITFEDIKTFQQRYYRPDNAILGISGNINFEEIEQMVKKYFEDIEICSLDNSCNCCCCPNFYTCGHAKINTKLKEVKKEKIIEKEIPSEAIYYAFQAPSRIDEEFYATTVLCEILNCGKSSILYKKLVEEKKIFNTISAEYVDNLFAGIFFIKGFVNENININEAENELNNTITNLTKDVTDREISKAKNNIKTDFEQDIIDIETSTDLLVNFTNFRDTFEIFESKIENVKRQEVTQLIAEIFRKENRSKLIYSKRI